MHLIGSVRPGNFALAFLCAFLMFGPRSAEASIAFSTLGGAANTPSVSALVGLQFSVTGSDIVVTDLGFYDGGLDGLNTPKIVAIYTNAGALVTQQTIPVGTVGTLSGLYRYSAVAPTLLTVGNTYRLVGLADVPAAATPDDTFINTFLSGTSEVNFTGTTYLQSSAVMAFPTTVSSPNGQYSVNFQYQLSSVPEPSTWVMGGVSVVFGAWVARRRRAKSRESGEVAETAV